MYALWLLTNGHYPSNAGLLLDVQSSPSRQRGGIPTHAYYHHPTRRRQPSAHCKYVHLQVIHTSLLQQADTQVKALPGYQNKSVWLCIIRSLCYDLLYSHTLGLSRVSILCFSLPIIVRNKVCNLLSWSCVLMLSSMVSVITPCHYSVTIDVELSCRPIKRMFYWAVNVSQAIVLLTHCGSTSRHSSQLLA